MPDLPDLDTRIRDLVTRAVADAPTPPEIGTPDMPTIDQPADNHRWWIGGTAAVLAAAAAVVTFALVVDDDQGAITPASVPTTLQPEPTASAAPTTPPTTPTPTATPGTSTPPVATAPAGLLTAGPGGVVEHVGTTSQALTTEPVVMALSDGDGHTIVQRRQGDGTGWAEPWTPADTVPLLVGADGALGELYAGLDWGGSVVLHDVEVVDGRRLLLYSVVGTVTPQEDYEDLWVVDLGTAERTLVAEGIGGWEFGTGRLHLASTGLVVGVMSAGPTTAPALYAVPGSAIAEAGGPDATALRMPTSQLYCEDVDECPGAYTISADGSQLAWVTPAEVWAMTIEDGRAVDEPHRLGPAPSGRVSDLEVMTDGAVASFDDTASPAIVRWDGTVTTLEGTTATATPGAAVVPSVSPTPAVTTTAPPTTTTAAPPAPAGVMMATAGPDGVAVLEDGVEVRRLDQPAEIALLTPGGAVIFQTTRPSPEGTPGDPQIWRPDGTVAPFLGAPAAGQSYRLHDVAQIDGVPTLLYGLRTNGPAPEDYTETVKALRLDPAGWVTDDIVEVNTWEGGFSRLSLSDQGLIVGTVGESVTSGYYGAVVPRSPAAGQGDPTVPPAGVEVNYTDCSECPTGFTVSADGASIAWTEGTELVVMDVATGERESWTVPALATETFTEIDVRTSSDGGIEVAITSGFPTDTDAPNAVVAATSPQGGVVETDIGARVATFGP